MGNSTSDSLPARAGPLSHSSGLVQASGGWRSGEREKKREKTIDQIVGVEIDPTASRGRGDVTNSPEFPTCGNGALSNKSLARFLSSELCNGGHEQA